MIRLQTRSGWRGARASGRRPTLCKLSLGLGIAVAVAVGGPSLAEEPEHAHEHEHGDEHDDVEVIVVTASPLEHTADELAITVDALDRRDIVRELGTTIGETLRNRPGVSTSGFSPGASRPVIRGQDAFRTEVLENGLSTQDVSQLSPDHGVPVNPLAAQRLEVVRGPAVLRYGGGASAGVVNALTNRVPRTLEERMLTGEALGFYGENADERSLAVLLEGGLESDYGDFTWHFDALDRDTDDYETGENEKQRGTDVDAVSVSGGGTYFHDLGRLGFAYSRFENEYGIPEEEPVEIDMRTNRYRFEGDLDDPFDGVRKIRVEGVYGDYQHKERVEDITGQTFENDAFDGRLEILHEPVLGFVGALGFQGKHQDLKARGEAREFVAPSDTNSGAFYIFEERALADPLDLQLGFRAEGTWVEGTPISNNSKDKRFVPISGSAALLFRPADQWTMGLTAAASQRAPSQIELYARGPHEATGTFEIGDPSFDEETSYTGELRVQGSTERFRLQASGFVTYYDDYIFGNETGRLVDEEGMLGGDLEELLYESRNTIFFGGEVALGFDLYELWGGTIGLDGQADYVRARFTDKRGNRNVPRVTPMRWGWSLFYEHERVSGRFGFLRTERQWSVASNEFRTGGYTMLDMSASYRLPFFEDRVPLEVGLVARNLLDDTARNAVSFNKEDVLLPGRSWFFNVRARF